jgi:hypothetical protein
MIYERRSKDRKCEYRWQFGKGPWNSRPSNLYKIRTQLCYRFGLLHCKGRRSISYPRKPPVGAMIATSPYATTLFERLFEGSPEGSPSLEDVPVRHLRQLWAKIYAIESYFGTSGFFVEPVRVDLAGISF